MPLHVAVIGFGAAGAASAILLARRGHRVTLFERAAALRPVGAGILLQPVGQDVLAAMGLLDRVVARAEPIGHVHAVTTAGRRLTWLPYADVGCRAYGLHRGELFAVLEPEARAAGVEIVLGCAIDRWMDGDAAADVIDTTGRRLGPFDLVLGADGSRSRLRATSGLRHGVHEYAHATLWAVGTCAAVRRELYQVTRGTAVLCGLLPMGGGRCSLFWGLRRDQFTTLRARGFGAWRDEVLRTAPQAAAVFETVRSFDDVAFTTYRAAYVPRPHGRRVALLGDAAHAMSPHLGQGVGLALADAAVLAACVRQCDDVAAALGTYARLRRRPLRYYAAVTALLAPFFQSDGVVKGWGRDIALPLLPRIPGVKRLMLTTLTGRLFSAPPPLGSSARGATARAGAVAPVA